MQLINAEVSFCDILENSKSYTFNIERKFPKSLKKYPGILFVGEHMNRYLTMSQIKY
jgi:hypothetical protein